MAQRTLALSPLIFRFELGQVLLNLRFTVSVLGAIAIAHVYDKVAFFVDTIVSCKTGVLIYYRVDGILRNESEFCEEGTMPSMTFVSLTPGFRL